LREKVPEGRMRGPGSFISTEAWDGAAPLTRIILLNAERSTLSLKGRGEKR
jgi:hypothetical protein